MREMNILSPPSNILPDFTVWGPRGDLARCVMPWVFLDSTAALCSQEV